MYAHGRRGSAPLLRPEELWGGLRGGAERPDQRYLSTRRGSAPSQQIHQGRICCINYCIILCMDFMLTYIQQNLLKRYAFNIK